MCGISGYFSRLNKEIDKASLLASMQAQLYRGPDAHAMWFNEFCGLAHARLSILDTSEGANQPMVFEEAGLRISYNGEVYNFKDLRNELVKEGYQFHTNSDTEVLLKGFDFQGPRFFEKVNGMFAVAIFNDKKNELFLIRDRFGIKPLYYFLNDAKCYFSSELGALMEFPIPRLVDHTSLLNYLNYSYLPDSNSILKGVKQLEPGSYLLIGSKSFYSNKYYQINTSSIDISIDEALAKIKEKCIESVNRRLISDVPLATFLSSGLDSSIITYLASKVSPGIKSYSAGFSDHPYFDESLLAKEWGEQLSIAHTIINVKEDELLCSIDEILSSYTEPFADSSAIAFNLLSKEVNKERKVILSGDGADELFGGYRKHKAEHLIRKHPLFAKTFNYFASSFSLKEGGRDGSLSTVKRQLEKWLSAAPMSNEERYQLWAAIAKENESKSLLKATSKNQFTIQSKLNEINDVLLQDFNQVLPGDMLYKVDRSSMKYGLEVRVPFLDHELVDFVFSLPSEWKLKGGERKYLLKNAFKNEIPKSIRNRRKKGFEVPLTGWLNGPLKGKVDTLLSRELLMDNSPFNFDSVENVIKQSRSTNPGNSAQRIWSLLVYQQWVLNYNPSF